MSKIYKHQYLKTSFEDSIAIIKLNRPEVLNACNSAMHSEIQDVIEKLEADVKVRVIIFNGAGRAFCSGSDLREVGQFKGVNARRYLKLDFATKNRVAACSKPVIAALHGHVAGGGFELALACDIRYVAEDVIFSLPEITLGTLPGSGGLQRLPQIVGLGIAKEWALSGRRIDAEEAYRTGLANRVFQADSLMSETLKFATNLAKRSSIALHLVKVALDPKPPATDGLIGTYHMLASQICHDEPMYQEHGAGFAKKRPEKNE